MFCSHKTVPLTWFRCYFSTQNSQLTLRGEKFILVQATQKNLEEERVPTVKASSEHLLPTVCLEPGP